MKRPHVHLPDASHLKETTPPLTGADAPIEAADPGSAHEYEEGALDGVEEVFPDDILPDEVRQLTEEETPPPSA